MVHEVSRAKPSSFLSAISWKILEGAFHHSIESRAHRCMPNVKRSMKMLQKKILFLTKIPVNRTLEIFRNFLMILEKQIEKMQLKEKMMI